MIIHNYTLQRGVYSQLYNYTLQRGEVSWNLLLVNYLNNDHRKIFSIQYSIFQKCKYYKLLSNSLSNVQMTHSNIQITSTNIQWYCTVQNRFWRNCDNCTTWQLSNKLLFIQLKKSDWQVVFSTNQNTLPHSSHTRCCTMHLASFLYVQIVYKIHYRNSWTINNLLDI